MEEINIKLLSASQINQLNETRRKILSTYEANSDFIQKIESNLFLNFTTSNSDYYFSVYNIRTLPTNPTEDLLCIVAYCPLSYSNVTKHYVPIAKLIECIAAFEEWVEVVRQYFQVINEYNDPFFTQFEKEFEDEFDIGNVSDYGTTLDSISQLKVYKLLNQIEDDLKKEDPSKPEIQKLLSYTKDFKENLHTLPTSIIKKKAIQLLSKLRKEGIKLYYDTIEIGYKEIIKAALIAGAVNAEHTIIKLIK